MEGDILKELYLKTNYPKEEYGVDAYPQLFCNEIYKNYFQKYKETAKQNIPLTLLDVGSGKGNHLVGFSRLGLKVTGLDKRDECIDILDDFEVKECDLEKDKFPFKSNSFDVVFSKSVLEHVYNTENFLSESFRVLKPGGIAIMMTPDWKSEIKFFWDDYTHVHAFTRKSLQNAMKITGFDQVVCDKFIQFPMVWKYPFMKWPVMIFGKVVPDFLIWKNFEESEARNFVRFSKARLLLSTGTKK